jgi:hypothetical protein
MQQVSHKEMMFKLHCATKQKTTWNCQCSKVPHYRPLPPQNGQFVENNILGLATIHACNAVDNQRFILYQQCKSF